MRRKVTIKTLYNPLFKHRNLYIDKVLEKVKVAMLKELTESNLIGCEGLTFEIEVVTGAHSKTEESSINKVFIDELEDWQLDWLLKI